MKTLKKKIIIGWVTTGMLLACFFGACGFFAPPVIAQLVEEHKASLDIHISAPPPSIRPVLEP